MLDNAVISLNVGVKNVEPAIRCVFKHIASFEIKELPQKSTLIRMFAEMKALSCLQLSEELLKEDNVTLDSDRTSSITILFKSPQHKAHTP